VSLLLCVLCAGAGGVSITLEDGSVETGDLLIGADGIWSKVRRQMIGESSPCYSGYTCYTGEGRGATAVVGECQGRSVGAFQLLFGEHGHLSATTSFRSWWVGICISWLHAEVH
jgi:2-polyprenyl-6-methoxyphenol hydroxylase-like FAD-dependent oxidoreductase